MIRTIFLIATLIVILGISGGASILNDGMTASDDVHTVSELETSKTDNAYTSVVCSAVCSGCDACGKSVVTERIPDTR